MNGIMIHICMTVKHSVKDSLIQCTCTYMCLHKQQYLRVPSRLPFCQDVAASQVTECNSTCLLPILPCDLIAMSSVLACNLSCGACITHMVIVHGCSQVNQLETKHTRYLIPAVSAIFVPAITYMLVFTALVQPTIRISNLSL